ncbi:MAG: SurA N-terminal domain-containing protein, partial [Nitrosopumilaceae archaeon]|nr:SurA N-terminal domain-containing protein [Nitrosopumilaceae archaeon]
LAMLLKAGLLIVFVLISARYLVPWLFYQIAKAKSKELFIIVTVLLFSPFDMIINENQSNDIDVSTQSENPIVAEINDEVIRLNHVEEIVETYLAQGQRLSKSAALDRIVVETLLLDEAEIRGIEISLQDAEEQLESNYRQNGLTEEQFSQRLEQLGTTYEKTLEMYRDQLIINDLLTEELSGTDITVSDQEAQIFYEQNIQAIKSQLGNATVFEDVSPQIKSTIQQQKQQQFVSEFIEELRDDAMIFTYKDRL